jgi:hypothetical protein
MTNNLTQIITALIATNTKASRELPRGLILAYTDASANDGTHRFTCSRRGVSPSSKEMAIVEAALKAALAERGRVAVELRCEPYLKRGRYQYHLWTWREAVQEELF